MTEEGILSIVGTPIGNLGDMTLRGIKVLQGADVVVCENGNTWRGLANKLNLDPTIMIMHRDNQKKQIPLVIAKLLKGANIAYVSEAGTPGINDPGALLVKVAIEKKITLNIIPGVSAITTTIMASNFPVGNFIFLGYLPRGNSARRKIFYQYPKLPMVFFATKRNIKEILYDVEATLGDIEVVIISLQMTIEQPIA